MKLHRLGVHAALFGLALIPSVVLAFAFSGGPPDGFAGNPPAFENCTTCHFSFEVNSGDGSLDILGLPVSYVPGQLYNLTIQLSDPGQERWGFELTALSDADFTLEGGTIVLTDPVNTQISADAEGTEDYLKHTFDGTYDPTPDGPVFWEFDWIAPGAETGPITFYLAGNAADGDQSFVGDYIYTLSYSLLPDSPTPTIAKTWGSIKALYK